MANRGRVTKENILIMNRDYKYIGLYFTIVFGVWWGTALCFFLNDSLIKFTGELTILHPLIVFFTYLPSITGLIIFYLMGDFTAVKSIVSRLVPEKQYFFWFPVLFMVVIVFAIFMHFGSIIFGIPVPKITYNIPQMISEVLINFVRETGIIGGVFGWVGFLLPWLQGKLKNNISSGLLTGLIFGLWLFPGFAFSSSAGSISYALYVLQLMTFFMFQSYVFNATKGSLLFYLFTFGLISSGSHIQLYYFNVPIQIMQIVFFAAASFLMHFIFKKYKIDTQLQTLKVFVSAKAGASEEQRVIIRNNENYDAP